MNTTYVTKVIQKALNNKIDAKLIVNGLWDDKTTDTVDEFRVKISGVEMENLELLHLRD